MTEERKSSFWATLPGILTGIAALLTAVTGILIATGYANRLASGDAATQSAGPPSSEAKHAPDREEWPIVADETFSGGESGWYTAKWEDDYWSRAELAVVAGKYRWELESKRNAMRWQESPHGPAVDFQAAVDVAFRSGTPKKEFAGGIMFGKESDRYYAFQVNNLGSYRLSRSEGKETVNVINWTPVPAQTRDANRLAVTVDDQRIRLLINSQLVGDFRDPSFKGGKVGLTAVNFAAGSSQVIDFDNFEFRRKP